MKERPMLFSAAMVSAILEGRKTQTRRVIKCEMKWDGDEFGESLEPVKPCPYGLGDHLWVRETWRAEELESGLDGIRYRADGGFRAIQNTRAASDQWMEASRPGDPWRPSIFMPRWASRITLEVTGARAERVQNTSLDDMRAEGVRPNSELSLLWRETLRENFITLHNSIYSKRGYGWDANPWAWAIEFNVL